MQRWTDEWKEDMIRKMVKCANDPQGVAEWTKGVLCVPLVPSRSYPTFVDHARSFLHEKHHEWLATALVIPHAERALSLDRGSEDAATNSVELAAVRLVEFAHDAAMALQGLEMLLRGGTIGAKWKVRMHTYATIFYEKILRLLQIQRTREEMSTVLWREVLSVGFSYGEDRPKAVMCDDGKLALLRWRCYQIVYSYVDPWEFDDSAGLQPMVTLLQRPYFYNATEVIERVKKTIQLPGGKAFFMTSVLAWCQLEAGTSKLWCLSIQLFPMHEWFAMECPPHRVFSERSTIQSYWCDSLSKVPQYGGKKGFQCGSPFYWPHRTMRYAIAVDKAILKHLIRLSRTPIRELPYEVIREVFLLIYGNHNFPTNFFRYFFTPTRKRLKSIC